MPDGLMRTKAEADEVRCGTACMVTVILSSYRPKSSVRAGMNNSLKVELTDGSS